MLFNSSTGVYAYFPEKLSPQRVCCLLLLTSSLGGTAWAQSAPDERFRILDNRIEKHANSALALMTYSVLPNLSTSSFFIIYDYSVLGLLFF